MSNTAATLLVLVKVINAALTLTRNLNISFSSLKEAIDVAEAENRDLEIEDLESLRNESDEAHQALKDAIAQRENQ